MISLYFHVSWFLFMTCLTVVFFSLAVSTLNSPVFLELSIFFLSSSPLNVSFCFDSISSSFISVVSLISTVIIVYSYNYMSPYSNAGYFLYLTILFIVSMLILISINNLFFILLGWDGLGLVSFFLIVYYQNQSSISSGLFTLLMNRVGDCLFLVSLALFFGTQPHSVSSPCSPELILCVFLCFTFMTNSAIFPFSPWLPLAIAAPTPISALVHSSTLVTAGLFLMMRYSYIILFYSAVAKLLLILSVFTSFYAGFNALFESDLNNLIALSTLSHLGFIGLAFFSGLVSLAFFHLLAHALFKSLLFIAIGDIIINLFHSQDIRFLSMGSILTPSSCGFIGVSLTNLLGIPSISGFFSNDLILETLNFSSGSSFLIAVVYLNVLFTFFYTLQLLFYFFSPTNTPPLSLIHVPVFLHPLLISILALISVSFGFSFLAAYSYSVAFLSLPFFINVAPLLLLALIVISLLFYGVQPVINSVVLTNYFSSIINLLHICISISSFLSAHLVFSLTNYCELGVYSLIPNVHVPIFFQVASNRLTSLSSSNPLILALLSLPFLITIMAL